MSREVKISRRAFARGLAAAVAAPVVLGPGLVRAAGRPAPSGRIALGFIGLGGRGSYHLDALLKHPQVQVVAVCDTFVARTEAARAKVNDAYAKAGQRDYAGCLPIADFRELVGRDDIDAVVVATPDHWHVLGALAAVRAGKDVYCEKPISVAVAEGRELVRGVREYGRVLQVGTQERSGPARFGAEIIRNGRLGKLHTVYIGLPVQAKDCGPQKEMPIPPGFDYNMWLGPAQYAPYTKVRCSGAFRYIYDYSGGEITDRGAHVADIALWALQPQLAGPVTIEAKDPAFYSNSLFDTAIRYHLTFTYASGLRIIVQHDRARGIRFEGDRGWLNIAIHGGALTASDPAIINTPLGANDVHLHRSPGHHQDFLNAVISRGPVVAPVEGGQLTATFCHLCNIALILNRKLTWDPGRERFVNDAAADRMLYRPTRAPWRLT